MYTLFEVSYCTQREIVEAVALTKGIWRETQRQKLKGMEQEKVEKEACE